MPPDVVDATVSDIPSSSESNIDTNRQEHIENIQLHDQEDEDEEDLLFEQGNDLL
jgi:hypothetical protein